MIGCQYLEHGQPVTVLTAWRTSKGKPGGWITWYRKPKPYAPRNVLVRRADSSLAVRPFRGLRRLKEAA